jgi:CheY-like chemotaxis protein
MPSTILVAEDQADIRDLLVMNLRNAGYEVTAVADGLEGMKAALSSAFDAVVTDAIMPHLSGQQLAAFIRNNAKLSKVPIILLTGQENKAVTTTVDGSIDAFLYKPVKADDLKNCIENCLENAKDQLSN